MGVSIADIGEFELIRRLKDSIGEHRDGTVGIGDDGAILAPPPDPSSRLVITTDTMIEGRHFKREFTTFYELGIKLMSVNLSDLAAMGATPAAATVSLQLPGDLAVEDVEALYRGLAAAPGAIQVVGGDTVQSATLAFGLTAFGWVTRPILRSAACIGDDIWISGPVGGGGLGLAICRGEVDPSTLPDSGSAALQRYRTPTARTELGVQLAGVATAAIDVSDGLLQDLGHIAGLSGVDLVVELDQVPLVAGCTSVIAAVTAGDDYELAFCAPPQRRERIGSLPGVRRIGHVVASTAGIGQVWIELDGVRQSAPEAGGYQHFQSRGTNG